MVNEVLVEEEVVARVPQERRGFVRRLVAGTPFAAPVVTSYDMDTLTIDPTAAQVFSNVT